MTRLVLVLVAGLVASGCGATGDGCGVGGCRAGLVCVALRDGTCRAECARVCAKPCPCPDGCGCGSDANGLTFCVAAPTSSPMQSPCTK
ncbi:MAG: hypothetical protein JNJ54_08210 [Myxococcaceae bacterium]|nr:hypothetical protein [Myxococcaceae bacterium]